MSSHRSSSLAIRGALSSAAVLCILLVAPLLHVTAAQRTVRVTAARVELGAGGSATATAYLTVENGTMYEVYLVGASTEMADSVELMQYSADSTAPVKEVAVPAFDRLEMSSQGVFMKLADLKRPLKPGEKITITLRTDSGEELSAAATVK